MTMPSEAELNREIREVVQRFSKKLPDEVTAGALVLTTQDGLLSPSCSVSYSYLFGEQNADAAFRHWCTEVAPQAICTA
jgi:hypothetical protein